MKISELVNALQEVLESEGNRKIILQADPEGNSYSPLWIFWTGSYIAETTYSGEAYLDDLTEADKEAGYTEEDVRRNGEKAIFLVPAS